MTSSAVYDIAVIGLGVMGSSTVYQATRLHPSLRVLGLEARPFLHDDGSSHGESRLTRQAYAEGVDYVPLALASHREWDAFGRDVGHDVLHRAGVVYLSTALEDPVMAGALASAKAYGIAGVETFDATTTLASRFPSMRAVAGELALWEPGAGWIEADNVRRAMVERARSRGATLLYETPVREWTRTARGTYAINGGQWEARSLVLAAGCWTQRLVPGLQLHPKRRVLHWYRVTPGMGPSPGFLAQRGPYLIYGFPPVDGLIKCGIHYDPHLNRDHDATWLADCDPDTVSRAVTADDDGALVDTLMRALFPLIGERVRSKVCLYNCSDDGHFVIDRHPTQDDVIVASGFSGHGFKFAIALGRVLTDLALRRTPEFDLRAFSIHRPGVLARTKL